MAVSKNKENISAHELQKSATVDSGLQKISFSCDCWLPDHHFFVVYDTIDDEVSVEVRLNHYLPWYKRAWVALKYFLGLESPSYDEVLLSKENRKKLAEILLMEKKSQAEANASKKRWQKLAGIKTSEKKD